MFGKISDDHKTTVDSQPLNYRYIKDNSMMQNYHLRNKQ